MREENAARERERERERIERKRDSKTERRMKN